jgi:hypothetical protein
MDLPEYVEQRPVNRERVDNIKLWMQIQKYVYDNKAPGLANNISQLNYSLMFGLP